MAKSKLPASSPEDNTSDTAPDTAFDFGAKVEGASLSRNETPTNNTVPAAPSTPAPDPFDPQVLRLSQDFSASVGVKKALLSVPVRKPDKSWFVRVHPDPNYRLLTAVIELKEDREVYLIAPALRAELATEPTFKIKMFATAINRQGVVFLWECNLPRPDGRADEWSRTGLQAVEMATKGWVRVTANMSLSAYEVFEAQAQLSELEWPAVTMGELLRIAFKDRYILSLDHPVLRRLRGEA